MRKTAAGFSPSTSRHRPWRQALAPMLRRSLLAAAVCSAWQAGALAAAPAPGTLPSGWSVVNGNVVFAQNGNALNINQLSPQAIANFLSFSIGSNAVVNISQPSAAAAFLARVTGGDISQIYGKLTAPGLVALVNPNGILVGPGGMVDVGRFIGSTLNIQDADFLAGKLNFVRQGMAGAVENQGSIKSATGGSVYLIGSSVANGGIIASPQGEVMLAAGQTVTLADTATPGVTVAVTGSSSSVTNLGSISAEAGRIGIAAGLIANSGSINASSVVREGGRIFLRAGQNLSTSASSSISADGTSGGQVTLVAQNQAFIDGEVSARGAPGHGGFVETSGLQQLDVVKAPTVGSGGSWLIDPANLEVVAANGDLSGVSTDNIYAVESSGSGSKILNSTIAQQLNNGTSVRLSTGTGGSDAGDITVSADIAKTAGGNASLTLEAAGNININAGITSTAGALNLNLNSATGSSNGGGSVNIGNLTHSGRLALNGGALRVSDGMGYQNGSLLIDNGSVDLGAGGSLFAGNLQLNPLGSLNMSGNASVNVTGNIDNSGLIAGSGSISSGEVFTNTGKLAPGGDGAIGSLTINGNFRNFSQDANGSSGVLMVDIAGNSSIDTINFTGQSVILGDSSRGGLQTRLLNNYVPDTGLQFTPFSFSYGTGVLQGSYFRNVSGDIINAGGLKRMVKATYGDGVTLALTDAATIAARAGDSDWGNLFNWESGYIPTAIDTVVINSGVTAYHGLGSDTIDKLVLNAGALNLYGGNLTVNSAATINAAPPPPPGSPPDSGGNISVSNGTLVLKGSTSGNGGLQIAGGGNVTMADAASTLNVNLSSGSLTLTGGVRLASLAVSDGSVIGNPGSRLRVTESVSLTGGNLTLADAAFSQGSGALSVGHISADNLVLEARDGSIVQSSALHVKKQLIASATSGITLNNAGNEIAAFAANNSGSGDILLTNSLNTADASAVTLNGVSAANGNISVNNTGTMLTAAIGSNADFLGTLPDGGPSSGGVGGIGGGGAGGGGGGGGGSSGGALSLAALGINSSGQVNSASGSVSLATHSPLTIGAGGISANGDIALSAGSAAGGDDNLVINGLLNSLGGNITLFAGNSMNINANVATLAPGLTQFTAPSITYAPGVTITDASGSIVPVAVPPSVLLPGSFGSTDQLPVQQAVNRVVTLINTSTSPTLDAGSSGQSPVQSTVDDSKKSSTGDHTGVSSKDSSASKSSSPAKMYCN